MKKQKVLVASDSPGTAEALREIIPLIKKKARVKILAIKTAYPILKPVGALRCTSERQAFSEIKKYKPDFFFFFGISSLSKGPYTLNNILKYTKKLGVPNLMFQDFWANHRYPSNLAMLPYWDAVCTVDNVAKKQLREDGFAKNIHVTGNPVFDKFQRINVTQERKKLRKRLGIKQNARVILYAGQGTPTGRDADKETFALLCDSIRKIKDKEIQLIIRQHPRSENTEYYQSMSKDIAVSDTSRIRLTDGLLAVADIVVSMYASNLIHACLLGVPAISIMLPKAMKRMKVIKLDDFPMNTTRATVVVYQKSTPELIRIINHIFTDATFRKKIREQQRRGTKKLSNGARNRVAETLITRLRSTL